LIEIDDLIRMPELPVEILTSHYRAGAGQQHGQDPQGLIPNSSEPTVLPQLSGLDVEFEDAEPEPDWTRSKDG
jgi:hypothetical protein